MTKPQKSILDELLNAPSPRDAKHIIESKSNHLITSAINIMKLIEESYNPEEAEYLIKKLVLGIEKRDIKKFNRSLGRINENKRNHQ